VFAYKSDIDEWLKNRNIEENGGKKSFWENRWTLIGTTVVVTLFLVLLLASYLSRNARHTAADPASIAVFPFENLNPDGYDSYLCQGLTNEIISTLSRLDKVQVIPAAPRAEALQNKPLKDNHTNFLLTGKMKKEEERLWVSVQLLRGSNSQSIWRKEYTGRPEDILAIQDQIILDTLSNMNIEESQRFMESARRGKTGDQAAFDHYLKGSYLLNKTEEQEEDAWKLYHEGKYYSGKWTQESNELAIILFQKAIQLDSGFAEAYIGLAQCYTNNVNFNWLYDKTWLDKAEELLQKANSLSPGLPEYYCTSIKVRLLNDLDFGTDSRGKAFALAQEGIQKYSTHPLLTSLAGYCFYAKFSEEGSKEDFDKAFELKEKAFFQDPHGLNNMVFAELLMFRREFARAASVCSIIEPFDSSQMVRFRLGEVHYFWGNLEKSREIFQQIAMPPDLKIHALLYLGMIAAQEGDVDTAVGIIKEIELLKPQDYRYFMDELRLASIYMGIRDSILGYKYLESFLNNPAAKKDRYVLHEYILIDKNFDPYREEQRFKSILEGENLWLGAKEYP
jgi:TolB-like protein